jgi:hypothetical protein
VTLKRKAGYAYASSLLSSFEWLKIVAKTGGLAIAEKDDHEE